MIKLSKRLETISSLIEKEDNVLDIGCDHALLDIYLSLKYDKLYYASDLRSSALEMANANIQKYKAKKVILRCGNGLKVLEKDDNIDTIVISGMGCQSILKILSNIKFNKKIKKLVIQSNSNSEEAREYLLKNGFYIEKEKLVLDKNIYYIVSSYKRGKKKYTKLEKEIGIFNDEILNDYIDIEIKKNNILLSIIPLNNIKRRYKIKKNIKYLKMKKSSIK